MIIWRKFLCLWVLGIFINFSLSRRKRLAPIYLAETVVYFWAELFIFELEMGLLG